MAGPTQSDLEYLNAHPEVDAKFRARFGYGKKDLDYLSAHPEAQDKFRLKFGHVPGVPDDVLLDPTKSLANNPITPQLENNNARMRAAANGEEMPPLSAPIRQPVTAKPSQLSRIGGNLLEGLGGAAETFGRGVDEMMGNRPADQQPTKLFGYEMPDVVSGGANVINGIGRAAGSAIGAGIDVLASPAGGPDAPLATEAIGENIAKPLMSAAQYVTGSETPGLDFMKSIGTDPRYAEAAVNVVPAAGAAKRVVGNAIKNVPKSVTRLIKVKDESYAHPSVTSNSLQPQDIASLGNDFDRIQSRTIFSQKLDPDVANVRKIMSQIVDTGQPVSVEAVEKMRKAINDYAYSPTTTAEEARALLMMREAVDNKIAAVNPQAAAALRNGRAASNRLRLVQQLIEEKTAAKVKGGPLTEGISKSAVLEKELIAEKALREKVGRGFKYTPQMSDKELYRLKSLVEGRTARNINSVIGKIASAPTLVRGVGLGLLYGGIGAGGFALGGPAGAAAAMGGILGVGGVAKGMARVGTGRAINALDRAYRQFTPEPIPQGPRITPTIQTPTITPVTPRPAPPAGPPPQIAASPPAPLQLAPPAAPGAAAVTPGPLPPSRQLPAPAAVTPVGPMKLPTPEEFRDLVKGLTRDQAIEKLHKMFPEGIGSGARTPGQVSRMERIVGNALERTKRSRKRKK